jgi:hypothetical protein
LADALAEQVAKLEAKCDRRRRIAAHRNQLNDSAFLAEQMRLETQLVGLRRQLNDKRQLATTLTGRAAETRTQLAQQLDNYAFATLPAADAAALQATQAAVTSGRTTHAAAASAADAADAALLRARAPRETQHAVEETQHTITNLERLIATEQAQTLILPAKRRQREQNVAQYQRDLAAARQRLTAAHAAHAAAVRAAGTPPTPEDRLRAQAITAHGEAATAQVALREQEEQLAATRVTAVQARRDQSQAAFDRAVAALPGGPALLGRVSVAEAEVNTRRAAAAAAQQRLQDFTRVANGSMEEPALRDGRAEVARRTAEVQRRAATLTEAQEQLRAARAHTPALPAEELAAFEDRAVRAEAVRNDKQRTLTAASERQQALERLVAGDAAALTTARTRRDRAQQVLEREQARLDQAAVLGGGSADDQRALQDAVARARREVAAHTELVEAGERGARIAVAPGLVTKRGELRAAEHTRDQAGADVDREQAAVHEILTRNQVSAKVSRDDKRAVEEALRRLNTKRGELRQAERLAQLAQDQITEAGDPTPPALTRQKEAAERACQLARGQADDLERAYRTAEETAQTNAENRLSAAEKAALQQARDRKRAAEGTLTRARTLVGGLQRDVTAAVTTLTATERTQSEAATRALTAADGIAQRLNVEYQQTVEANPTAAAAQAALDDADGVLRRAQGQQTDATVAAAAARAEVQIVRVQQEALANVAAEARAFERFRGLTPQDFEDAIRNGVNSTRVGALFPPLPEPPAATAPAAEQQAYATHRQQAETERAAHVESLRTAQQTMDRLVERDQMLEEAGASFEDRKRAFEHIPETFLPPRFREELRAYRQVDALFREEDEQQRAVDAKKKQVKESLLSALGELGELAEPILNTFLDAMDVTGAFVAADGEHNPLGVLASIQDTSGRFSLANAITGGITAAMSAKDMVRSENEMLDHTTAPADEEEASRRRLRDESKKVEVLKFLKEYLLTTAKAELAALNIAGQASRSIQDQVSSAIPVLGAVIASVEAAIATADAAAIVSMAIAEGGIRDRVVAEGEDDALASSMNNQAGRSANRAVQRSVHATAKVTQAVGAGLTAGGVTAVAGAATQATGKGLEYGNRAVFQCIDWSQAEAAARTLELARAGSHEAMQEVFRNHQKYATMYICLKARNGDARALAFCQARGLNQQAVLDSATSLKLIRKEMLKAVDQADHMATFGESVVSAWDKICRGCRLLVGRSADAAAPAAAPAPAPTPVRSLPNRPTPQQFEQMKVHALALKGKADRHEAITDHDVAERTRFLAVLERLAADLVGDDWPELEVRNQGGKKARERINEVKRAFEAAPSVATVSLPRSQQEQERQQAHRTTAPTASGS